MQLSIITVNLNNDKGLAATMRSVFAQTFTDFEYIVIDGASSDGSKPLIKENENKLAYWTSQPDGGIYAAMNKGISAAKGKYLLFLNSGDTLTDKDILKHFFQKTLAYKADIYYTDVTFVDEQKKIAWTKQYPTQLNEDFFIQSSLCHQTSIIAKKVLHELGGYDQHYSLASDWMFSFTAFKKGYVHQKIKNLVLSNYLLNGYSADFNLSQQQRLSFIKTNYPVYLNTYLKFIDQKSIFKRIKSKLQQLVSTIDQSTKRENYIKYLNSLK